MHFRTLFSYWGTYSWDKDKNLTFLHQIFPTFCFSSICDITFLYMSVCLGYLNFMYPYLLPGNGNLA